MWSTVLPTQHSYTRWGRGCSIALSVNYPRAHCGRMGFLIFSSDIFLLLSVGRASIFISFKLSWWVLQGRNLYSHCTDKESCSERWWHGSKGRPVIKLEPSAFSSRAQSRAPYCLPDELSVFVWIICRHLQPPSGSGAPCSNYRKHHYSIGTHTHAFILLYNMIKSVRRSSHIFSNKLVLVRNKNESSSCIPL